MTCEKWLEQYIKLHQPVPPAEVYKTGKDAGFTRGRIKEACRWYGKYIDTQIAGDNSALWRWRS